MREKWVAIKGYEGLYEVSNHGQVRSLDYTTFTKRGAIRQHYTRVLKPGKSGNYGHLTVALWKQGSSKSWSVHRLVLSAFVGPCPQRQEVRHLDGNAGNNRLDNLKYGTSKENSADQVRHGTRAEGDKNGQRKLSSVEVKRVLTEYATGTYTLQQLADKYGVKLPTIHHIVRGRTWRSLGIKIAASVRGPRNQARGEHHGHSLLTRRQVLKIRHLYASGNYIYRELASQFGVSPDTICDVVLKRTWAHV